jgi:hypothetical protein
LDANDFLSHFYSELGIEVGERLVQQQHIRLDSKCSGKSYALLLTTTELMGSPCAQSTHLYKLQSVVNSARNRGPGEFLPFNSFDLQPVCDVVEHSHVRPKCVVLETHPSIAFVRRN